MDLDSHLTDTAEIKNSFIYEREPLMLDSKL
jgi:hypothetical protein